MVVSQTALCPSVKRGSWNRTAEAAGRTETCVVGHDEQHIWRPLGSRDGLRKLWLGFIDLAADDATERRVGHGQYRMLDRGRLGRSLRCAAAARGDRNAKCENEASSVHGIVLPEIR